MAERAAAQAPQRSRRRLSSEDHGPAAHEAWVVPYADLLTLLLAFFVVMYSLSSLNEAKYRPMAAAISGAMGHVPPPRPSAGAAPRTVALHPEMFDALSPSGIKILRRPVNIRSTRIVHPRQGFALANERDELVARIRVDLKPLVDQGLVTVRPGKRSVEVDITSDILFQQGSSDPSPVALTTTQTLAGILAADSHPIRVSGHTDNTPIRSHRFPSNWELSTARAASIGHRLMAAGIAGDRLEISGFGEFRPIASNADQAGRNANRRVRVSILLGPAPGASGRAAEADLGRFGGNVAQGAGRGASSPPAEPQDAGAS